MGRQLNINLFYGQKLLEAEVHLVIEFSKLK